MALKRLIFSAVSLMLIGCGTAYNGNADGGGGGNNAVPAQGIYLGQLSGGYAFSIIVLPNNKLYGIYGTASGNTSLSLFGLVASQGTLQQTPGKSATYTANVTDYFYTGAVTSGSIMADYVAESSSLNGSLTESGTARTFTGTGALSGPFDYGNLLDEPASLSTISGTWTGTLLDGINTTVTISPSGSVIGSSSGCSFTGTVAPDTNKRFFNVSFTFGVSPCAFPNQTATGIGFEYLLTDGITHQLLATVVAGPSAGTVFAAAR